MPEKNPGDFIPPTAHMCCRSIVLDYDVHIAPLRPADRTLIYGTLGNYSLAGFEMILHRYVSHYIITYYLPSGEKDNYNAGVTLDQIPRHLV